MKKVYAIALLGALFSVIVVNAKTSNKAENDLKKYAEWLRGERRSYAGRYLAAGATIGAGTGAAALSTKAALDPESAESVLAYIARQKGYGKGVQTMAALPKSAVAGAIWGGLLGVIWSLPIAKGLQLWQRRKINNAIQYHLNTDLKALSIPHAILIVAAYKRNVPVMKELIDRNQDFVDQNGVWPLLTELFFNKNPTGAEIKRLQEMIQKSNQ